jgi:hypothetical protein
MYFQVKSTLKSNRNHTLKHEKNEGFSIGTLRLLEGYHWDILNYKSRSERIKQSSVLFCSVPTNEQILSSLEGVLFNAPEGSSMKWSSYRNRDHNGQHWRPDG